MSHSQTHAHDAPGGDNSVWAVLYILLSRCQHAEHVVATDAAAAQQVAFVRHLHALQKVPTRC